MSGAHTVAEHFVTYYYSTFDSNRKGLESLYRPTSMLTFEGDQFQGTESITTKLTELPFQQVKHKVSTFDAQPVPSGAAALIVMVTGALIVDGSEQPLNFSQVFHLVSEAGTYYVQNDIFRLNY